MPGNVWHLHRISHESHHHCITDRKGHGQSTLYLWGLGVWVLSIHYFLSLPSDIFISPYWLSTWLCSSMHKFKFQKCPFLVQYHHAKINMREFKTVLSNLKSKYESKFFFISLKEDKTICCASCFLAVMRCNDHTVAVSTHLHKGFPWGKLQQKHLTLMTAN